MHKPMYSPLLAPGTPHRPVQSVTLMGTKGTWHTVDTGKLCRRLPFVPPGSPRSVAGSPTFGRGFRGTEGPLNDRLGFGILLLQKVYGFSQIQQLSVLREKRSGVAGWDWSTCQGPGDGLGTGIRSDRGRGGGVGHPH